MNTYIESLLKISKYTLIPVEHVINIYYITPISQVEMFFNINNIQENRYIILYLERR